MAMRTMAQIILFCLIASGLAGAIAREFKDHIHGQTFLNQAGGPGEVDFIGYCSNESIPIASSYWMSLNTTLTDLIENTPNTPNMSYSVQNGRDSILAFGAAQCFGLGHDNCKSCISYMVQRAWKECGNSIAAQLTLSGKCSLRYQDIPIVPTAVAPVAPPAGP